MFFREPNTTSAGKYKIRAGLAALIVAAALPGCAVFLRSSKQPADQKITADVEANFGGHAHLEPPNLLDVQTINRIVYPYRTVSTVLQPGDAELVASQLQGVEKVVNSIAIAR